VGLFDPATDDPYQVMDFDVRVECPYCGVSWYLEVTGRIPLVIGGVIDMVLVGAHINKDLREHIERHKEEQASW
jgi:hypothetical protein